MKRQLLKPLIERLIRKTIIKKLINEGQPVGGVKNDHEFDAGRHNVMKAVNVAEKVGFRLEDVLFNEQLAFVREPARFATAVCSVRAGKTTACAADLIDTALTMPGTTGLYITLARSSAKRIVWPDLHRIAREFKFDRHS